MKVISLLEPWSTLIKEKVKYIETRSWKTNYRGELYIHSSSKRLTERNYIEYGEQLKLLKNSDFKYGYIIAKCKLVDCIVMTEELIEEMKKNHTEYICGDYKVGRYAWILEEIESLDEVIFAKGSLGIWDYYNENQIMNMMNEIEYGWIDKNGNKNYVVDESFSDNYFLQSPKQLLDTKIGVCWDQVELERRLFKNSKCELKTYFICHYDGDRCPSHTFLTYVKNNKFCWFEHSWANFKGIHEFDNEKQLLDEVKNKFILEELNGEYNENNLIIREYSKPKYGINVKNSYNHCEKNKIIVL